MAWRCGPYTTLEQLGSSSVVEWYLAQDVRDKSVGYFLKYAFISYADEDETNAFCAEQLERVGVQKSAAAAAPAFWAPVLAVERVESGVLWVTKQYPASLESVTATGAAIVDAGYLALVVGSVAQGLATLHEAAAPRAHGAIHPRNVLLVGAAPRRGPVHLTDPRPLASLQRDGIGLAEDLSGIGALLYAMVTRRPMSGYESFVGDMSSFQRLDRGSEWLALCKDLDPAGGQLRVRSARELLERVKGLGYVPLEYLSSGAGGKVAEGVGAREDVRARPAAPAPAAAKPAEPPPPDPKIEASRLAIEFSRSLQARANAGKLSPWLQERARRLGDRVMATATQAPQSVGEAIDICQEEWRGLVAQSEALERSVAECVLALDAGCGTLESTREDQPRLGDRVEAYHRALETMGGLGLRDQSADLAAARKRLDASIERLREVEAARASKVLLRMMAPTEELSVRRVAVQHLADADELSERDCNSGLEAAKQIREAISRAATGALREKALEELERAEKKLRARLPVPTPIAPPAARPLDVASPLPPASGDGGTAKPAGVKGEAERGVGEQREDPGRGAGKGLLIGAAVVVMAGSALVGYLVVGGEVKERPKPGPTPPVGPPVVQREEPPNVTPGPVPAPVADVDVGAQAKKRLDSTGWEREWVALAMGGVPEGRVDEAKAGAWLGDLEVRIVRVGEVREVVKSLSQGEVERFSEWPSLSAASDDRINKVTDRVADLAKLSLHASGRAQDDGLWSQREGLLRKREGEALLEDGRRAVAQRVLNWDVKRIDVEIGSVDEFGESLKALQACEARAALWELANEEASKRKGEVESSAQRLISNLASNRDLEGLNELMLLPLPEQGWDQVRQSISEAKSRVDASRRSEAESAKAASERTNWEARVKAASSKLDASWGKVLDESVGALNSSGEVERYEALARNLDELEESAAQWIKYFNDPQDPNQRKIVPEPVDFSTAATPEAVGRLVEEMKRILGPNLTDAGAQAKEFPERIEGPLRPLWDAVRDFARKALELDHDMNREDASAERLLARVETLEGKFSRWLLDAASEGSPNKKQEVERSAWLGVGRSATSLARTSNNPEELDEIGEALAQRASRLGDLGPRIRIKALAIRALQQLESEASTGEPAEMQQLRRAVNDAGIGGDFKLDRSPTPQGGVVNWADVGPGAAGWSAAPLGDGVVQYTNGAAVMVFRKVSEGRMLMTTELPLSALMEWPKLESQASSLAQAFPKTGNDRSAEWPAMFREDDKHRGPMAWAVPSSSRAFTRQRRWFVQSGGVQGAQIAENTEFPLQAINFERAKSIADALGCHLPTVDDWVRAVESAGWRGVTESSLLAEEMMKPGQAVPAINMADADWKSLRDSVNNLRLERTLPAKRPHTNAGALMNQDDANAVQVTVSDGVALFSPLDLGKPTFEHLIGNVAEWGEEPSKQAAILGGSALSTTLGKPLVLRSGFAASQAYTDVGMRLAFSYTAPAGALDVAAEQARLKGVLEKLRDTVVGAPEPLGEGP